MPAFHLPPFPPLSLSRILALFVIPLSFPILNSVLERALEVASLCGGGRHMKNSNFVASTECTTSPAFCFLRIYKLLACTDPADSDLDGSGSRLGDSGSDWPAPTMLSPPPAGTTISSPSIGLALPRHQVRAVNPPDQRGRLRIEEGC